MDVSIAPKDATQLSRAEKLLYRLDKSMKILEIGPSYNPTALKSQGWNCWTIDHDDQATLRVKYKDAGVDVSVIEPVDFIWRDGPLDAVIPQEHMGTFDACIASHVIEHFPNPVQVLRSLQSILTKDGMLSLAVPDKRFCFDYFKPMSMTGDLLHADFLHTARHTRRTAFNHVAYAAYAEGIAAWGQHDIKKMTLVHSLAEAKTHFDELDESPSAPYVDHHAWHYTPSSFRLVVLELNVLGVLEWMEDVFFPAAGCEFFVTLKRQQMRFPSDSAMEAKRLQLLEDVLHDVHEQCVYFDGLSPIAAGRNVGDADARTVRMAVQMTNIEACQEELLRRLGRQGRDVGKIWEVVRAYKKLLLPFRAARRAVVAVYTKRGAIREYIANRAATAGLVPASPMQPGVSDTAPSAPLAPFAADAFPAASPGDQPKEVTEAEPGPLRIRVTRVDESWEIAPELFDHFAFESGDELTILPEAAAAALLRTPDGCANIRTATGSAIRVPTRFDLFLFRGLRIPVYLIELTGAGADTLDHLGKAHMDNYRKFVGLSSGMSILDIGCGIGRDALQFLDILDSGGGYLGIDVTRDSIVWCRREISSRYPNFYFHHFDAANEVYNPLGRQSSSDFSIPAADKSIDRILLASVFTHLFEDEVQHYLNEFKRVLRLDGLIYASFFLYSEETLAAAKVSGKTPWKATFEHTLGRGFFANDPVYPRGAVAITDEAMRRMITESGLRLTRPYLKGWWSGLYEYADDGQDVAIIGL